MAAHLPELVIDRTRDWCFEFNFGEWFDNAEIEDFIRREFNYSGSTPRQYAERFIKRAVDNRDFETRHKQWRWIVHP